ncbi:hypothetical protein ACWGCP_00020 [Streptomyces niveus]
MRFDMGVSSAGHGDVCNDACSASPRHGVLRQVQRCCQSTGSTQGLERQVTMNELKPVDDDLSPEVRALVEALRNLFAGLAVSTRRYAARRAYDSSTVSRYLSGRRLPPWEFVLNLLHDVAEERGTSPTQETVAMLRSLHATALRSGNSPAHQMQLLERQLAEADRETRQAAARERWLEETLQDREHRVRDLEMRYRELQAITGGMSSHAVGEPTPYATPADDHARLHDEVRMLQEELVRVRALHQNAQERCERLERLLAEAERQEGPANGTALLPVPVSDNGRESEPIFPAVAAGTSYHFGEVLGTVNLFTDAWQVDEEFVASVTVRLQGDSRHLGNGLLLDGRTVLTSGAALQRNAGQGEPGHPLQVVAGERTVGAAQDSIHHLTRISPDIPNLVTVLRLAEAVPFPDRPLSFDWRLTPGRQLLVGAHAVSGPYSCLLNVTGRTGDWLRVTGEIIGGLTGAPAFSRSGAVAGLVMTHDMSGDGRGLVLPVAALRKSGALASDA